VIKKWSPAGKRTKVFLGLFLRVVRLYLFENLILKYLPDIKHDINIWLWKNDFPERFYIRN